MVEKLKDAKTETPVVKREKAAPVSKSGTVKKCSGNCKSEFQDSLYGEGMRAMNATGARTTAGGYRCTVCRTMN